MVDAGCGATIVPRPATEHRGRARFQADRWALPIPPRRNVVLSTPQNRPLEPFKSMVKALVGVDRSIRVGETLPMPTAAAR